MDIVMALWRGFEFLFSFFVQIAVAFGIFVKHASGD
jgi:hypothetical protein